MALTLHQTTIVACATAAGRAGVAMLRLSGPRVRFVTEIICGHIPSPRKATLCKFRDAASGDTLDEGLVLFFPAPHSFTGEDVAEFHLHGSQAVVRAVLTAITNLGQDIRIAQPGEFSKRAFFNGKMDLAAIEGLADLIDSETEWQRKQALRQMQGALSEAANSWRTMLIECMALVEADLDFSDEGDVPTDLAKYITPRLMDLTREMQSALHNVKQGERIREGYRVVIAGAPNVGKSSLLNSLAKRDVAIVSPIAGTTRDVIEIRCDIRGYPVLLADTAGLHETADHVEAMGIDRARREIAQADLLLLLGDTVNPVSSIAVNVTCPRLVVATKADLGAASFPHDVAISIEADTGLDSLLECIGHCIESLAGHEMALVTNERQRHSLQSAHDSLERVLSDTNLSSELVAEELRHAAQRLDMMIGRVDSEHVLDQVFSRFCIGK